jgi:hypothetical protein
LTPSPRARRYLAAQPEIAELYQPLGSYLRSGAGLSEPVREVCILAIAGECHNAFERATHEPEALRVGSAAADH